MKKTIFHWLSALLIAIPGGLSAQIPNPDFEQWDTVTLTKPSGFTVYGISKQVAGYKSKFAVWLQKDPILNQGPGAVIYGDPENGFTGGIPAVGRPDSAVGYFKYHIISGDTAWYLVFFKRKGKLISQDIFYITGSDSNVFHRLAYKINYSDTGSADSVVVGVASTNPNDNKFGSFIIADSLHFVGGPKKITIPNGNFEQWNTVGFNNPAGWFSSNNQQGIGSAIPISKTTDKVFSKYACKIENISLGGGQFAMGYIMAGRQGNQGPMPGFRVFGKDSILYCNYKCYPQNGDTINIAILMYRNDTLVGQGQLQQWLTVNSWTQTAIHIGYFGGPGAKTPDSAAIFCSAFQGGSNPKGNSVLYVDGLKLNTPMNRVNKCWVLPARVYPNPAEDLVKMQFSQPLAPGTIISISDASGKKMTVPFEFNENNTTLYLNTNSLSVGVWFYEIQSSSGIRKGNFMILR